MANDIVVPRLGWSMDEGVFVEWLFKDGDYVSKGDSLFVIEGDKAAEEVESFDEGFLSIPENAPMPGDTVKVGEPLGFLLAEGEAAPEYTRVVVATTVADDSVEPPIASNPRAEISPADTKANRVRLGRIIASPRARRKAAHLGIPLSSLTGSGRNGRIREIDVKGQSENNTTVWESLVSQMPSGELQPFSARQKAANTRLVLAHTIAVPVTLTRTTDVSSLVKYREKLNTERAADEVTYSIGDLISYAVIRALDEFPSFNSYYTAEGIVQPPVTNLAIAMDSTQGLIVPVVHRANELALNHLASNIRSMKSKATDGSLTSDDLKEGTFTITNLGMYGIDHFTPVLNPPQSAILGIGAIKGSDLNPAGESNLTMSLTIDHRVHDGAPAARFLQSISEKLADWE